MYVQLVKVVICGIYIFFMNYAFSQNNAKDSLLKKLSSHPQQDTTRIKYLLELIKLISRTDKEKSLEYAYQALQTADSLKNIAFQIKTYINIAKVCNLQNKPLQSLYYYQKAIGFCERHKDTINLAEVYYGMATIYRLQEKYEKSEQYNKRALQILTNDKYNLTKAKVYNNLGILHYYKKEYEKALEYYQKSLSIKEKVKDSLGLCTTLYNLSMVHTINGPLKNKEKAKMYADKAEIIAQKIHAQKTITDFTMYLANLQLKNGEYEEALKSIQKMLAYYKENKQDDIYIQGLITASQIYYQMNNYIEAMKFVQLCIEKIHQHPSLNLYQKREIFDIASQIYEAQKNYQKALEFRKKEIAIKDSIFEEYKKQENALAENDYELLRIEQTNQKLQSINKIQKEHLRKQGITIAFVITAFTLASVLAILLMYVNSSRNYYIKQLKSRNEIITKINNELIKSNEIKDKIFSIISHDLRSPLATTKGLVLLLKDDPNLSDEFKVYFNEVSKNIDNTFILLDNLLKWSMAQMQSLKVNAKHFCIQDLIEEVTELYRPIAQEKNIEILVSPSEKYTVLADRDMLHLVLRNLVSNAIKFTPEDGKIEISTEKREKELAIHVKDTGVGIPKEHLDKIFEGLSTRGTASEKGTGLGLQLCKEFITLNNGELKVKSVENEGSTFSFTVPLG